MVMQRLDDLKKAFKKIRDEYELPSFDDLNRDFEIEKLQDIERDFLIRDIRRTLIDKNLSYFKFLEMFLNPGNGPIFFMSLTNNLNNEEKKKIEQIYFKLGKFELDSINLDNKYDEAKEAEFIKKFYSEWENLKEEFGNLMGDIEEIWEREVEKDDKVYLG